MNQQPTSPTTLESQQFCRRCDYELRGLTTPRCPECGRAFDPANPKSYLRRPLRRWMRHVKRAAIVLLTMFVVLALVWGWFFWGWYDEQRALAEMKVKPPEVDYVPIASPWWREHLGPVGFALDRVAGLDLGGRPDITDISPVTCFRKLDELHLEGTRVTDISPLVRLKSLGWLELSKHAVSDIQIGQVQRALPRCTIAQD